MLATIRLPRADIHAYRACLINQQRRPRMRSKHPAWPIAGLVTTHEIESVGMQRRICDGFSCVTRVNFVAHVCIWLYFD